MTAEIRQAARRLAVDNPDGITQWYSGVDEDDIGD